MKKKKIFKSFVISHLVLWGTSVAAWTVTNKVVELPGETAVIQKTIHSEDLSQEFALGQKEEKIVLEKEVVSEKEMVISTEKDAPVFHKKNTELTSTEKVQGNYWRAVDCLNNQEPVEAENLLLSNLNILPKHHPSRSELATLYLKNEQLAEAEEILKTGLRLDPKETSFLKLMAVLEEKKGDPEKALGFLVKVKDYRVQDKNYVALLGHLYQETGNYGLARSQYLRLIEAEPNNPVWLLGVTVSWDAEGNRKEALAGYHRLDKGGKLDPKILSYVRERIKALKG